MQKILLILKRIITFFALAILVTWLNVAVFFAIIAYWGDNETIDLIKTSPYAYNNGYNLSLLAFVITYIIAKQLINKKTQKKLQQFIWYIITYFSAFWILLLIPYPE